MNARNMLVGFLAVFAFAAPVFATDTVYVDLSGIDSAFPEMTDAQRQELKDAIIADIQANFTVAGVDINVTADAAAAADRTIHILDDMGTHEKADGTTGHHYGEWAEGSSSVNVHLDNFTERHGDDYKTDGEWDIAKLTNGIGRTAAHEIAHSYSVGHNTSDPPNKMTEGGLVPSATRASTEWIFDDHTGEVMNENLGEEPCDSTTDYDEDAVQTVFFETPDWPFDPDEYPGFDAHLMFEGSALFDFDLGWLGQDTDDGLIDGNAQFNFIYKASAAESSGMPDILTFLEGHHDEIQFVIRGRLGTPLEGEWFMMNEARLSLDNPIVTPNGDEIYRILMMAWDTDGDNVEDYIVMLDSLNVYAPLDSQYNGFRVGRVWPCMGDLDHDYDIDLSDLAEMLSNYGTRHGASFEEGDMDGDGDVDLSDLAALLSVYGTTCSEPNPPILPGIDRWNTPCEDALYDFSSDPLPADFFGPGSDPFDGIITFGSAAGEADTEIQRLNEIVFPDPLPASGDSPIQLVRLDLVSCQPITVLIQGEPTLWDVRLDLSDFVALPPGVMTVTKEHQNGGTFTYDILVQPRFTFTSIGYPGGDRIYDAGLEGRPPLHMLSLDPAFWSTDESCDAGTIDGFAPGVIVGPCGMPVCSQSDGVPAFRQCMIPPLCPPCP